MRRVQTSRRPKGETKSNRYTLQTEIAATPTKQTTGTHVNRYEIGRRGGPLLLYSSAIHESPVTNHRFEPGLEIDAND